MERSLFENIQYFRDILDDCKLALEEKGVEVPHNLSLDEVAEYINELAPKREPAYLCSGQQFYNKFNTTGYERLYFTYDSPPSDTTLYNLGVESPESTGAPTLDTIVGWKVNGTDLYVTAKDKQIYANKDCSNMFYQNMRLRSIDFKNFKTDFVENMNYMFSSIGSTYGIESFDLSGFDTSNVKTMQNMFFSCAASNIDLSSFNTSKVTTMANMFQQSRFINLDLSSFTSEVLTTTTSMFNNCLYLESVKFKNFEGEKVTAMGSMFSSSSKLSNLDMGSFSASAATTMSSVFNSCSNLETLDLSNFTGESATNLISMLSGCTNLKEVNLSNFNPKSITSTGNNYGIYRMFYNCQNLTKIIAKNWTTNSNISSKQTQVFTNCTSLSGYSTSKVTGDYCKPTGNGGYFTLPEA